MKAESTIRRQLRNASHALKLVELGTREEAELYATQQSLAWVLGQDVMPPVTSALSDIGKRAL